MTLTDGDVCYLRQEGREQALRILERKHRIDIGMPEGAEMSEDEWEFLQDLLDMVLDEELYEQDEDWDHYYDEDNEMLLLFR